jgi:hypothetical protein
LERAAPHSGATETPFATLVPRWIALFLAQFLT